jgi:hypothetical protein
MTSPKRTPVAPSSRPASSAKITASIAAVDLGTPSIAAATSSGGTTAMPRSERASATRRVTRSLATSGGTPPSRREPSYSRWA